MAGQEQQRKQGPGGSGEEPEELLGQASGQINTSKVDSVLDEIDSVLEANAEDFVRNFVQKGGQ